LDEGGKLLDRLLAPFGGFEPIADVLPDRPVELDQFLVGGGNDTALRGFDQRQDFGELGLESIGHELFATIAVMLGKGRSSIRNFLILIPRRQFPLYPRWNQLHHPQALPHCLICAADRPDR
jgi:hypothetical protein